MLRGLRERYMELFGVLLSTSAEAQRMYCSMAAQKHQAEKSLKSREKAVLHLQQQLLKYDALIVLVALIALIVLMA